MKTWFLLFSYRKVFFFLFSFSHKKNNQPKLFLLFLSLSSLEHNKTGLFKLSRRNKCY
ncbi:hypothetical protein GLYMA_14G089150v4 [Glycine max]|nr:hypothetical protein GLYMA_14G089150v4 [Glycine max]KAH1093750.1 hypothetical protein GYH30_039468 [Glycine max]